MVWTTLHLVCLVLALQGPVGFYRRLRQLLDVHRRLEAPAAPLLSEAEMVEKRVSTPQLAAGPWRRPSAANA
jgi:hypothetical protein